MANILRPHQRLAGYEILELVGKGGMGEVYRARQISMDRTVAIKVLSPRLVAKDESFAERFVAEARAAGKLQNPNIINVHDVGKAEVVGIGELSYFSMEYVEGESVKQLLAHEHPCSEGNVALVMHGMVEALAYAEKQGIVHRDIKPDNIMITTTRMVKLADLGLALNLAEEGEPAKDPTKPKSNMVMGTPLYMSPEQARAAHVDPRSDQYSLGATLFHMLTGDVPYKGTGDQKSIMKAHVLDPVPDPKDINPDVPETWRQICMKLMAKSPDDRFAGVAQLQEAVQAALRGVTLEQLARRSMPLMRRAAGGGGMPMWAVPVVVLVLAVVVWHFCQPRPAPPPADDPNNPPSPSQPSPSPTGDQTPPPPTASAPDLKKLQGLIDALPADPDQAQPGLDRLAADPQWKSPDAAALITAAAASRRAAADARNKAAIDADLAPLKAKLAAKDISGAKDALTVFAKNHPDDAADIHAYDQRIKDALKTIASDFNQRITAAQTPADVDAVVREVHASALSADDVAPLETLAGQRRNQLAANDQARTADMIAKAWANLAAVLDQQRRVLRYTDIAEAVDNAVAAFPADCPDRDLAKALDQLGDKAASGENSLVQWVRQHHPLVDVHLDDKTQTLTLESIAINEVIVVASDGGDRRVDRGDADLKWRDLLDKALPPGDADSPKVRAACLWMWKAAEARAAIVGLGNDPLAKALAKVDDVLRGGLDLNGQIDRRGDQITVVYDFSTKDQIADFAGDGLSWGQHGMSWTTKLNLASSPRREADLPTVQWRAKLVPPVSVRAEGWIHPKTMFMLIGVEAGGQRVRLGCCNVGRSPPHLGLLVTDPDNTAYDATTIKTPVTITTTDPVDIGFDVDEKGNVSLLWDLVPFDSPKPLALPAGAPVTVILEAYQTGGTMQTDFDLSRLEVTGQVPKK